MYCFDKPLIGVDYLPLRRAFLEAEFPENTATQDRWLKITRITPLMVNRHGDDIVQAHLSDEPYRRAIGSLDRGLSLWQESKANLLMVAPSTTDKPWLHLSSLPEDSPVRQAARDPGHGLAGLRRRRRQQGRCRPGRRASHHQRLRLPDHAPLSRNHLQQGQRLRMGLLGLRPRPCLAP